MVEVRYRDRLGNNMLQYCLGRIIAEELGLALSAKALPGFPDTGSTISGAVNQSPEQTFTGQQIDLEAVLSDRSPRKIILDGWFQRYEYYAPHRARIKQWMSMDPTHDTPCVDADLVMHVRRTDYVRHGWAQPFSYYQEAIERALPTGGRLVIVTDEPADPFFWRFRRWRPRFHRGSALEQMSYMSHAPRLVMSASTFSWWSSFLGEPQMVVCPLPSIGMWSPTHEHEVDMIERDRFVCLPYKELYSPNLPEAIYQRIQHYRSRLNVRLNRWFGLSLPVH